MRLLVVGLAATGSAIVVDARAHGHEVTVIEDHPSGDAYAARARHATELGAEVVESPTSEQAATLARRAHLVVPSPGVLPSHPAPAAALAAGLPVRSEIDLGVQRLRARVPAPRVVAVTGTNGKTTVTSMIASMCSASGIASAAVGNIGHPLIAVVEDDLGAVVAEVSSFQLAFTTDAFAPDVAVLLNVAQDHIDWHGSVEAYAAAKAKVFEHQDPSQAVVVNADDPVAWELVSSTRSRTISCSRTRGDADVVVRDGQIVGPGDVVVTLPTFRASHDVDNALAATAAALAVGAVPEAIMATLAGWTNLPHRLELIARIGGVDFVDDSKATNAHATASALDDLDRVVLVAGGRDRSRDLDVLRPYAPRLRAVVAIGEATSAVESVFGDVVPVVRASSMRDAVREAAARAEPGDTVLLSPACASLDCYSSYAERGDDFAREVASLRTEPAFRSGTEPAFRSGTEPV